MHIICFNIFDSFIIKDSHFSLYIDRYIMVIILFLISINYYLCQYFNLNIIIVIIIHIIYDLNINYSDMFYFFATMN